MAKARSNGVSTKLAKLTRREREIMDVLFQRGAATVAEVMEALADPPGYSAVRATLNVLKEKGHAQHRQDGPRYVYIPAIPATTARGAAMKHLVNTFFGGSAEQAVVALLEMSDTQLSSTEIEQLSQRIHDVRREGR